MLKSKICLFWIVFMIILFPCMGQESMDSNLCKKIDSLISLDVPEEAPGLAFGIVMNGKIVFTRYAGFENLESKTRIDADSRFNIASNAKQFVAVAILNMIDQGALSLEDDLRKFFPSLYTEMDTPILIEHLLTHTSGIRDFYELLSLQNITWWKTTRNNLDVFNLMEKQKSLNFKPGSDYLYSNTNYILLAEIIAMVSEMSFREYMSTFFQQLGMSNTSFESDYTQISNPVATPYFNFDSWFKYDWIWNVVGDGNLFTTLPDQLKWEQIIQTNQSSFLNRRVIELSQKRILPNVDYGYGLEFSDYKNQPVQFHHGATGAWKSTLLRFPKRNVSFITITNSGKVIVQLINEQIADWWLSLPEEDSRNHLILPEPTSDGLTNAEMLGVYQDSTGFTFHFYQAKDTLYLQRLGRRDIVLERESQNIFHQTDDSAFKLEFLVNEVGQTTVRAYYPTHAPYTLFRVSKPGANLDPSRWVGQYLNSETDVSIEIDYLKNRDVQIKLGNKVYSGLMVVDSIIKSSRYTLIKTMEGFQLDGNRIRNITFIKSIDK